MQAGGNANGKAFFKKHNNITSDIQQKYSSRAAVMYREKIERDAIALQKKLKGNLFVADANDTDEANHDENFFEAKHDVAAVTVADTVPTPSPVVAGTAVTGELTASLSAAELARSPAPRTTSNQPGRLPWWGGGDEEHFARC